MNIRRSIRTSAICLSLVIFSILVFSPTDLLANENFVSMNSENPAPALGSHLMMSGVQITETDGTSFAVTRATGEVALLQPIESGLSISHMRAVLLQSARGLDSPGRDLLYRQGLIDFQQAVDELSTSLE